ncbi:MAG: UDP-N-acetylmuramoyl-L-alanine--D-glutamate ligase [Cyanophyceae cyanobacterium]
MPKADIIGLGRSGIAAARLLKQDGWEVRLSDRACSPKLNQQKQELEGEGIQVQLGHTFTLDDPSELIVVSPGVPWDIPVLVEARSRGIDTIGELELAWRYLQTVPWIGITGTNGKTTTTALTAAIFKTAGLVAPACGNIGYAACEIALQHQRNSKSASSPAPTLDWIIAEISSYQIESSIALAPQIGLWTTFTADHLSRHQTLANYYYIKASLLRRSQQRVFNGDDPFLRSATDWQNVYWTSIKGKALAERSPTIYIEDGWVVAFDERVLPTTEFKMVGDHNLQNLLLAVAAARLAGIDGEAIASGVAAFAGVPHRLEKIRTLADVEFINDSKATNYEAAQVGLMSVTAPAIVIAGGQAKTGDDTGWLKTVQERAAAMLLIGEAAPTFAQRLKLVGYERYEIVETMEAAIERSLPLAQQYQASVVLLSPACASFDQYQSFEHRGEHFRQLCQQL